MSTPTNIRVAIRLFRALTAMSPEKPPESIIEPTHVDLWEDDNGVPQPPFWAVPLSQHPDEGNIPGGRAFAVLLDSVLGRDAKFNKDNVSGREAGTQNITIADLGRYANFQGIPVFAILFMAQLASHLVEDIDKEPDLVSTLVDSMEVLCKALRDETFLAAAMSQDRSRLFPANENIDSAVFLKALDAAFKSDRKGELNDPERAKKALERERMMRIGLVFLALLSKYPVQARPIFRKHADLHFAAKNKNKTTSS